MKKSLLLAVLMTAGSLASLTGCGKEKEQDLSAFKVAMITDYGDITDQSFNQATYEGAKDWCDAKKVDFKYYKPTDNSDEERIKSTNTAIDEGYNVIVMPGYAFAPTIEAVAAENPDVKIIALDVSAGDFSSGYQLPANVYCAVYQEELAGYMAGYAAVKEGYTKLGFLGGMAVPAVVRYGYGFVQGCNDAAAGAAIEINYVYGGQFFGDSDITAKMDTWYAGGTEVVFACGGGIYSSACEAAMKLNPKGKVIGVDVDQSYTIKASYADGMCITSAMKGLYATVQTQLQKTIVEGAFKTGIDTLGLVSGSEVEKNYVQLPVASWSMTKFKVDDYKALVAKLYAKEITVSNAIDAHPTVAATTTVNYQPDIH